MTTVPSTMPCQVNRWAATVPGSMTPIGVSMGAVATAISWMVRIFGVDVDAQFVGHHVDRLAESVAQQRQHGAGRGLVRGLAEQHHVAHHVGGVVGADVGELLGPHVADVPAEPRASAGSAR